MTKFSIAFGTILLGLVCFALSPKTWAVSPPPDGGYGNRNTAEGDYALFSLTSGYANTAIGFSALYNTTTNDRNTAIGYFALVANTNGYYNTATGSDTLENNTSGSYNTADGFLALAGNTTGSQNTATGAHALGGNNGTNNTADGFQALLSNTSGNSNTATGESALKNNDIASNNTADGFQALFHSTGGGNTAVGKHALVNNTTGSSNVGVGLNAGSNLTTGSNNIDIGNGGVAGESNTIRIGGSQTRTFIQGISGVAVSGAAVVVNGVGQLGVTASSECFKDEIKPMDKASETILSLKPVTFRYKKTVDAERLPQFGLIAEEVAKVNPDLVVRDNNGSIYTVRYDAVNAMLLNEFLKEHHKVQELEANARLQDKEIKALVTTVKEQSTQIQKVSAQLATASPSLVGLQVRKSARQIVLNNHQVSAH